MVIDPKNNVNTQRSGDVAGPGNRQVAYTQQQPVAPPAQEKTGLPSHDTVVLSSQAKAMKILEEKIGKQSSVNREKVERVKAAIARGEYPINFERVAEKLLDYEDLFMKWRRASLNFVSASSIAS